MVVGVNRYEQADEEPIEILRIDPALERKQIGRLQARARRDAARSSRARGAEGGRRGPGPQPDGPDHRLRAGHVSEGEMVEALQAVFGSYTESPVF